MLDNRKISLMTGLAIYEKGKGRQDIHLAKYYRADYIRMQLLKTLFSVTIAYLLSFCLLFVYCGESLLHKAAKMGYEKFAFLSFVVWLILFVCSELYTLVHYSFVLRNSRVYLKNYYNRLRILRKYYREEEGQQLQKGETNDKTVSVKK